MMMMMMMMDDTDDAEWMGCPSTGAFSRTVISLTTVVNDAYSGEWAVPLTINEFSYSTVVTSINRRKKILKQKGSFQSASSRAYSVKIPSRPAAAANSVDNRHFQGRIKVTATPRRNLSLIYEM